MPGINIRFMQKQDLDEVVDSEEKSHASFDADFERIHLPSYAWTESEVKKAVSQYKSKTKKTPDTRGYVAEILQQHKHKDRIVEEAWVCGGFIYELNNESYDLILFTSHPKAPSELRLVMLDYVVRRAQDGNKSRVTALVPDGDWVTLKFFRQQGWPAKLVPNFYEDKNDAWLCSFELRPQAKKQGAMAA